MNETVTKAKPDLKISISGRIDSGNAVEKEKEILEGLAGENGTALTIDASGLTYISSAGLRVILRLKKRFPELKVKELSSDVYEIFEMTGFTEMMTVTKALRRIDIEGCDVIGEGLNGRVVRLDHDNVVKVYKNEDALSEITHEREMARLALILGVPTAISCEIVKVGDGYGSVFELLDAESFASILAKRPDEYDRCLREYLKIMKTIHAIRAPEGKLPSMKRSVLGAAERIRETLPPELGEKLCRMIGDIPEDDHLIHGDLHAKNIVVSRGEVLVIDMDTLSTGHFIFEFLHIYDAYIGFSEYDHDDVRRFQGFDFDTASRLFEDLLAGYTGVSDPKALEAIRDMIRCVSYTYLVDRSWRHFGDGDEKERAKVAMWTEELKEILMKTDSLSIDDVIMSTHDPDVLDIEANVQNLPKVIDFIHERLDGISCSEKMKMQVDVAVEEVFVNIADYAYRPEKGNAVIRTSVSDDPQTVTITFTDSGRPFDPLGKDDPDVSLPADERGIGGLGIFMTKKMMDGVSYEYRDGRNILTLQKRV